MDINTFLENGDLKGTFVGPSTAIIRLFLARPIAFTKRFGKTHQKKRLFQ